VEAVRIEMGEPGMAARLQDYDRAWQARQPVGDEAACLAGFSSFHVDPAGRLMPCIQLRQPAVDLSPGQFLEGWQELGRHNRPAYDPGSPCSACQRVHLCAYCPGLKLAGEVPPADGSGYHCQVAKARQTLAQTGSSGERGRREVA
jgi:radical SAM protein with 4Fe4S-binding SPASM domain